jgi:predicted RNA-binding protein YlxR (DUF448 family)
VAGHRVHIPIRTCIVCGSKRGKKDLIRLVVTSEGFVIRDDSGKEKGRGAYVCPSTSCWKGLEKGHILRKAFRTEGPILLHSEPQGQHGNV